MKKLKIPLKESEIRGLKIGDPVSLSGVIFTARDMAHRWLFENDVKELKLKDSVIYHCGPIVKKTDGKYEIIAAGPTTSNREEPYEWKIIKDYGVRAIIGKGGMGEKTNEACKKYGCVYLHAVGGAGVYLAKKIKSVKNVYGLEFGTPEAVWEIEVEDFPAVVTIDADGNSLHKEILESSKRLINKL